MVAARAKLSTTAKGLGHRHRVAVEGLRRAMSDGSPCDWCGRPRYLDRTRNFDFNPEATNPTSGTLHGDHSGMSRSEAIRRGVPIQLPDRLLHGACNIQRGEGGNDHLAASSAAGQSVVDTRDLAMAWPW